MKRAVIWIFKRTSNSFALCSPGLKGHTYFHTKEKNIYEPICKLYHSCDWACLMSTQISVIWSLIWWEQTSKMAPGCKPLSLQSPQGHICLSIHQYRGAWKRLSYFSTSKGCWVFLSWFEALKNLGCTKWLIFFFLKSNVIYG